MSKSKSNGVKGASFAKGGSNKMFGRQGAIPAKPGSSSNKGAGGPGGGKFAKGGSTKMFGQQSASPAKPGSSSNKGGG